ncbi:clustered mitochondria protein-like isoform X2 [Mangifera indica]|uniref:clustered mitochondria protein-like isoform X2 n=1 Tax=Mangifera indica TaxID=29780 RepID=UPI001CFA3F99|nr:clustered mitochondria protein-like isoform X2 [Mangifera indica]
MAGKSNKGRNRKGAHGATTKSSGQLVSSDAPANNKSTLELANGVQAVSETTDARPVVMEAEAENSANKPKQGDTNLYPVSVRTQSGEKLELQLNPGDSVMDVRQFLLDAPETCFFTCYDLLLQTKDGSTHHLEDYNEISEVADITTGGCSLEMVAALYDDRSVRAHVHRTKDLLSLSTLHASLSTSLALQYDLSQSKASSSADTVKTDVLELDGLGFMEDVSGSLGKLLSPSTQEIKCVESIVFSSFNPPPSYRRLVGDLIYLDVVTLEGNKYCITGTTKVFYVNSSTGNVLDPRPSKATSEATTLIGLLQKISPKFKKAFREILERKASAHPFENVQSLLPPNSWLGLYPVPDHKHDAARAEDALTLSYGSELIGMQRDWNEELQSCQEFPHTNPQERVLRDRALYKVTSDFVDAAVSGAVGVISRCIPPINPTDPECFHMYVHNNIFFSFAVDADLEQLSRKHPSATNLHVEGIGTSTNSSEKLSNDVVPGDGAIYKGESTGEPNGVVELAQVSSETQLAESEQATYASANNDLKGTKAFQEADVPGLYNLAMAIIDYRGHRVVAQSVLPGILQGDKSDSLLYGSVDNGKKISWNEDFHSKVLEAAKHLHLKEHTVLDGSGNVFKLAAPVECKGIVGSDDRHYLLDLMRVTPRDANCSGPGSRFCILRPELITAFCQAEAGKSKSMAKSEVKADGTSDSIEVADAEEPDKIKEEKNETVQECASTPIESSESCEEIQFNPNVLTEFKLAGNQEEIAADEESVRKVSSYLANIVLPKFIQDLCALEASPMDGQTLTEALHAHGINIRYIGRVADGTKHVPHLWDLCSNEIVVRSTKHIIKNVLRDVEDHDLGPAIAHFFNCFFGSCQTVGGKVAANGIQFRTQKKDQASHHSSGKPSKSQARWKSKVSLREHHLSYMNISSETLWSELKEFAKLKYQFELPGDARLRVKKVSVIRNLCQKVGISIAARKYDFNAAAPFQTSDILNLQPVVKHSVPVCSEAKNLVEMGKAQLSEGLLSEAYTLFSEAFSILQQVTGPMHREVANCCRYLAMVLYHAGDMAGAIMQQHKELIINERCMGLDHPDTAHSGLLSMSLTDTRLWYFQHEKKTYDILVKQLGEEDSRTKDSQNWMKTFKMREHQMNVQKQKGQALNAASTQKAIDILKANPDLMHAFQSVAAAGGSAGSSASVNSSLNAAVLGETIPRGRGFDERAARAAAEVRKKATAKGLLIRPHGLPAQALPPLTQLLNIINSGITSEANGSGATDVPKKEANGDPSNDPSAAADAKKDKSSSSSEQGQLPAGLGKGLTSLDSKKKKTKAKLTS